MAKKNLNHLLIDGRFYTTELYISPQTGGGSVIARGNINRRVHGKHVKLRFSEAINDYWEGKQEQNFVFVVFKSALGFDLDIDKFDDKGTIRIAFTKVVQDQTAGGELTYHHEAGIYLDKKGIANFLKKIEEYINDDTWQSINAGNPRPKNNSLIANIQDVQLATLNSFWQEPELPFPDSDDDIWWEVWLDYTGDKRQIEIVKKKLESNNVIIGRQWTFFPEHAVGLIKASAKILSETLLYMNSLSELRKPRDLADFLVNEPRAEQNNWIDDLVGRIVDTSTEHNVSVCLLDTGVMSGNPLLAPFVQDRNLMTIFDDEQVADKTDIISGHGTPMAGLILFGDLSAHFGYNHMIALRHQLESVRIIDQKQIHAPQNYGFVTSEALSNAIIRNPENKRVVCLAVSGSHADLKGEPSVWSGSIDMLSFGETTLPNDTTLFITSAGNLSDEERITYPLSNDTARINDPSQAFNSLTIGAYTLMDQIDFARYPNSEVLARRGALSPCSTTSVSWDREWPKKPDVVMEGGNQALQAGGVLRADSLQLLSTSRGATLNWLTSFGDTSAATALASRLAAILYLDYPQLWPESIRGLIVHSAYWTKEMLHNRNIQDFNADEKNKLLRTVGYGVPNLDRARASASNSLTLISEATLKPFKWENSRVKTDEFHLYKLPWPVDVLAELLNTPVKLSITLSYFIEPNPGNKRYQKANNYMSHALRFKMINSNESQQAFAGRVSKSMQDDDYMKGGDEKGWALGETVRNKGSLHKDIWEGSAADLATRNMIAIYPTSGWWKTRKKLKRYENTIRYSLIVSISIPNNTVDIYTPVMQEIKLEVNIPIDVVT